MYKDLLKQAIDTNTKDKEFQRFIDLCCQYTASIVSTSYTPSKENPKIFKELNDSFLLLKSLGYNFQGQNNLKIIAYFIVRELIEIKSCL